MIDLKFLVGVAILQMKSGSVRHLFIRLQHRG